MVDGAGNRISGIEEFPGTRQYGIDSPRASMVRSRTFLNSSVRSMRANSMRCSLPVPFLKLRQLLSLDFKQQAPKLHA